MKAINYFFDELPLKYVFLIFFVLISCILGTIIYGPYIPILANLVAVPIFFVFTIFISILFMLGIHSMRLSTLFWLMADILDKKIDTYTDNDKIIALEQVDIKELAAIAKVCQPHINELKRLSLKLKIKLSMMDNSVIKMLKISELRSNAKTDNDFYNQGYLQAIVDSLKILTN